MTKHVSAFTYKPKIQGVIDGTITQTIRKGNKFKTYDEILFHGWKDKPYRSPWSWRKRCVLKDVINIWVYEEYISHDNHFYKWDSLFVNSLATLDGVPHGNILKIVLMALNGKDWIGQYQIIRWS